MKKNLTPDQEAWLFQQKEIAKVKAPKGQSCANCQHVRKWEYARNIFYCSITRSSLTQNGMAKTKARSWCKDWNRKDAK